MHFYTNHITVAYCCNVSNLCFLWNNITLHTICYQNLSEKIGSSIVSSEQNRRAGFISFNIGNKVLVKKSILAGVLAIILLISIFLGVLSSEFS